MARKIIKGVLFVLAAVVVAGGIMTYLRTQKKSLSTIAELSKPSIPDKPKESLVQQITVNSQGDAAQVQIKGITGRNYHIQNLENGQGFKIDIPNTQIQQVQKMMEKPHPLIERIEMHQSADNPQTAEIFFHTPKNVNFLDSQQNDTLTIDFVKSQQTAETEEVPEPEIKKTAPKSTTAKKSTPSTTTASKTTKKSTASKPKPPVVEDDFDTHVDTLTEDEKSPTIAKTPSSKLESFEAPTIQDEDFENQLQKFQAPAPQPEKNTPIGFSSLGSSPSTQDINQGTQDVPVVNPNEQTPMEEDDGFNLKDVAGEETPKGDMNLLDAETQLSMKENLGNTGTQVAAIPQNQKFDVNQIKANLPAIQNMTVQKSGNATVVSFDREKSTIPFKFFKMVNPSRIVVQFKDAKSLLKSEYPSFSGTKVRRAETREYAGPDGMFIRVILYVDGAPNFTSSKKGNQVVVQIE